MRYQAGSEPAVPTGCGTRKGGRGLRLTHQLFCPPSVSGLQFDTPCGCKAAQGLKLTGRAHSSRRATVRGLSTTACQTASQNRPSMELVDFRLPNLSIPFERYSQSILEYHSRERRVCWFGLGPNPCPEGVPICSFRGSAKRSEEGGYFCHSLDARSSSKVAVINERPERFGRR